MFCSFLISVFVDKYSCYRHGRVCGGGGHHSVSSSHTGYSIQTKEGGGTVSCLDQNTTITRYQYTLQTNQQQT